MMKKTFESLARNNYQCPQCSSTCPVRNNPFEEQTISLSLKFGQGIHNFEETHKSFRDVIGDVYCPICPNEKCVHASSNKDFSFYDCKKCITGSHVLNNPFRDQKFTFLLFGGDRTH